MSDEAPVKKKNDKKNKLTSPSFPLDTVTAAPKKKKKKHKDRIADPAAPASSPPPRNTEKKKKKKKQKKDVDPISAFQPPSAADIQASAPLTLQHGTLDASHDPLTFDNYALPADTSPNIADGSRDGKKAVIGWVRKSGDKNPTNIGMAIRKDFRCHEWVSKHGQEYPAEWEKPKKEKGKVWVGFFNPK